MRKALITLAFVALPMWVAAAQPNAVLAAVDRLRSPAGEALVRLAVTPSQGSVLVFDVHQGKGDATLAIARDKRRSGERYLFRKEGLWFYAPGTRRAIRIPAIQRLRGEAVVGDLARSQFARDYDVVSAEPTEDGGMILDLSAKSDDEMFARIRLRVVLDPIAPIDATFFLASGKTFRRAEYGKLQRRTIKGVATDVILQTSYVDTANPERRTGVEIIAFEAQEYPLHFFTVARLKSR